MSTSTGSKVTPLELLRIREETWAQRLSPTRISLVAEDVTTKSRHTEQALGWLGTLWAKEGPGSTLLRRFPAVHVLTTTRVATDHYAARFWPELCRLAGVPNGPNVQHDWGQAYLHNLRHLGLPTFDDVEDRGSRFVGPILMHSGVPTYCLADLLRLVRDRRRTLPGLTPEMLVDWAAERARQDRLRMVDKPVQRFLRYGGEFAVDVVDRVFELLDVVSAGGTGGGVELPPRFAEAAIGLRDTGESLVSSPAGSASLPASMPRRAALMIDPYGRGPFVRLPSIPDADEGQVVWVVGADADEQRVASTALLPGYREPTPQVDVPIARPVRQITARLEGSSVLNLTVPVVDSERPLLVFDEEGSQLSLGAPLRQGVAWVLHPVTHPVLTPTEEKILARAALPPGWDGWQLLLLDLEGVPFLRLEGNTHVEVQARSVPRILMPEPVPGVHTMSGDPVFAQLPGIVLPDVDEGQRAAWSVSLIDHAGTVLVRRELSTAEDCESVWSAAPPAICGEVQLRVRGPWGRTASRRFTLVEGLELRAEPSWRRMTGRGLTPATVHLLAGSGIRLSRGQVELSPSQVQQVVSVFTGPEKLPLVIEPGHMSVTHLASRVTGRPSVFALQLQTEALLDDPGMLVVSTGAQASPVLHVHGRFGVVQTMEPQTTTDGSHSYRFPLAQVTDTLRVEQQLRLSLDPEGELMVAFIRPGRLFSDITVEESVLCLADAPDIEGLTAICYLALAPWRGPEVLSIIEGRATLPSVLVEAGPMLVHVRVEDPWVPEPIPSWPHVFRWVSQPGHLRTGPNREVRLSAFLAGQSDLDRDDTDLAAAWTAYDRLWQLGLGERGPEVDAQLRSLLTERANDALKALARATIQPHRVAHALIRTELIARSVPCSAVGGIPVRRANVLPMTLLGAWSGDEDVVDELVGVCGDIARDVASGTDPLSRVGGFDRTTDILARKTAGERAALYRTAGIVPAGMLEKDSRVLAAETLLAERHTSPLSWLRRNVEWLTEELRTMFRTLDAPAAVEAMDARRHPVRADGWRAIPEWSIGMAFACRIAAHRDLRLPPVDAGLRAFKDLVTVAPDLVSIDLVLADLLVRHTAREEAP